MDLPVPTAGTDGERPGPRVRVLPPSGRNSANSNSNGTVSASTSGRPRSRTDGRTPSPYSDAITRQSGLYIPLPPVHLPLVMLYRVFFRPGSFRLRTHSAEASAKAMLPLTSWVLAFLLFCPLMVPPFSYAFNFIKPSSEPTTVDMDRGVHDAGSGYASVFQSFFNSPNMWTRLRNIATLAFMAAAAYLSGRWGGYRLFSSSSSSSAADGGVDEAGKRIGKNKFILVHVFCLATGIICGIPVVRGDAGRVLFLSSCVSIHLGLNYGMSESLLGRTLVGGGIGLNMILGMMFGLAVGSAGAMWSTLSLSISVAVMVTVRYLLEVLGPATDADGSGGGNGSGGGSGSGSGVDTDQLISPVTPTGKSALASFSTSADFDVGDADGEGASGFSFSSTPGSAGAKGPLLRSPSTTAGASSYANVSGGLTSKTLSALVVAGTTYVALVTLASSSVRDRIGSDLQLLFNLL